MRNMMRVDLREVVAPADIAEAQGVAERLARARTRTRAQDAAASACVDAAASASAGGCCGAAARRGPQPRATSAEVAWDGSCAPLG